MPLTYHHQPGGSFSLAIQWKSIAICKQTVGKNTNPQRPKNAPFPTRAPRGEMNQSQNKYKPYNQPEAL